MNCISCDSNNLNLKQKISNLGLPVFHCKKCGLYITGDSKDRIYEKVSEIYKKSYWDERTSEKSINSGFSDIDSEGKKRNWISQFAYCKQFFNEKKEVLEIGSGVGQAMFWFESKGFNITGIEPDARNVKLINKILKNSNCVNEKIEDIKLEQKFDIIWMVHVLEHLVDPVSVLIRIKNNMKKNSIFFIEVPNCENKKMLDASINENPHVFHFTKKSLENIIKKSGFKIKKMDYFRPATKKEGIFNKISKKYFPYYPRIVTDGENGRDLRVILSLD
jgi:2-polyprenyl-3-methyl-5-hydroxy-6-metoxy-1,4-benzoquinol methylase